MLKSGCRIEAAQLRNWPRLHRLEAIYSIVAWRLLTLTYQARLHPESPCEPALSRDEWTVLYAQHNHRLPHPHEPAPTLGQVVMWIAQLGGYWGRKQDAPPGVKVLWRGLMRLSAMVEGFNLAFSLLPVETRCG